MRSVRCHKCRKHSFNWFKFFFGIKFYNYFEVSIIKSFYYSNFQEKYVKSIQRKLIQITHLTHILLLFKQFVQRILNRSNNLFYSTLISSLAQNKQIRLNTNWHYLTYIYCIDVEGTSNIQSKARQTISPDAFTKLDSFIQIHFHYTILYSNTKC